MTGIQFLFRDAYGRPREPEPQNGVKIHKGIVVRCETSPSFHNPYMALHTIYPHLEPGSNLSTIHKKFQINIEIGSLSWYDYIVNNRIQVISADSWKNPGFALEARRTSE